MRHWVRSGSFAVLAILGLVLTSAPPAEAGTSCKEIMACALDTGRGFLPKDVCDACDSPDSVGAVLGQFKTALEDPSISSACGSAQSIKWIKDKLSSGVEGPIRTLVCAINPSAGTVDSLTCNESCQVNCGSEITAVVLHFARQRLEGIQVDEAAEREAMRAAEEAVDQCKLQCGCGLDKLVCEEGAARLAEMACEAMGLDEFEEPKKAVGETCDVDSDCVNDACGRATAAEGAGKICCPSGSAPMYAGYDYCSQMADGSRCWSDAMCASQICAGNAGGTVRGTCTSKRAAGEACSSNDECANDACGRATAADGTPTTCCASGALRNYGGFDYCASMPSGSVCWSDAMCASGNCKGNMNGLRRGTCR
jgi:hypothetical protein